jgi:carbon storage regulator CsrA
MSRKGAESMPVPPLDSDLLEPSTEVVAVRKVGKASQWALAGNRLLRVLVADGNRDAADSFATLVKMWGHDVRQAYDGRTALEMTSAYRPDILFLDIALPKMNGCQLARRLRHQTRFKDALLIALTAYADKAHRRLGEEAGFDLYLSKPAELSALRSLLWLERARLARSPGDTETADGNDWNDNRRMYISHENGGSTMLVLSRRSQESVLVGGSDGFEPILKVTVLEIRDGRVRLGFEVDADVPVHRLEVWERIYSNDRPFIPTEDPGAPIA